VNYLYEWDVNNAKNIKSFDMLMACLHRQDVLYSQSLEFRAHSYPHNKRQATDASLQVAKDVDVSKRRKIDDFPLCFHCHKLGHLIDSYWMKYPNKKIAFNSKKDGPSQPTLSLNAISLPPPSKQCFRKLLITCLLWPPKRLEKFGN